MQLAVFDDLEHLWHPPGDYWDAHLANLASHTLLVPSPGALGVGAGAPPVQTEAGFLLFFHERRADGSYTMNLALLDKIDRAGPQPPARTDLRARARLGVLGRCGQRRLRPGSTLRR